MSLINEALKRAQRSRGGGIAPGANEADGPIVKREQPKSAKSTLIVAVGAVALVVVSMVLTAWWMSRPAAPTQVATAKPAATAPNAASAASSTSEPAAKPLVVLPAMTPPAPAPTVEPTPPKKTTATATSKTARIETPRPSASSVVPPSDGTPGTKAPSESGTTNDGAAASDVATTTPSAAQAVAQAESAPPAPPVKQDEKVNQFIDSLHVMGVRASGGDSKVLMNDRVYRVNDIVDRTLGVKLTKVANDNLTFTDPNGAIYVKYF